MIWCSLRVSRKRRYLLLEIVLITAFISLFSIGFVTYLYAAPTKQEVQQLILATSSDKTKCGTAHEFSLLPTRNICTLLHNKHYGVVFYVKSISYERDLRQAVRETWGGQLAEMGGTVIFAIGQVHPEDHSKLQGASLKEESTEYGDILQGKFTDTYLSNSVRFATLIQWHSLVMKKCKWWQKIMVLVLDRDTFVKPLTLVQFIDTNQLFLKSRLILGESTEGAMNVARNPGSKWFIPPDVYPFAKYPMYIYGYATLYSADTAMILNDFTCQLKRTFIEQFNMEDVLFSGIFATMYNVPIQHTFMVSSYLRDLNCTFATHVHTRRFDSAISPKVLYQIWTDYMH